MAEYVLENEVLTVRIASHGAELKSIRQGDTEYLWKGDKAYWGRTAPVLFPLVGNFVNKTYRYRGQSYTMSQHGFARDREFTLLSQEDNEIWLRLREDEDSLRQYPFPFLLDIGYRLSHNEVTVLWRVTNPGNDTMHFSLGGHPAFCCPLQGQGEQTDYYLDFHENHPITYGIIDETGCYTDTRRELKLTDGMYQITSQLFDEDALIVEDRQAKQVSLCDASRRPYVTVSFDAPLFGLWSPAGKHAPFVCIEPWYGRCDHRDFTGSLEDREYGHTLEPGQIFNAGFSIMIH